MKRAATPLAGLEKTGVHTLVQASPNVVDVEVSFTGVLLETAVEPDGAQLEVDAALQSPDAGAAPARQDRPGKGEAAFRRPKDLLSEAV